MKKTGGSVASFIAGVTPAKRRRDAETLVAMLSELTGRDPELWGSIIGFGSCHYRYRSGTEGDMPVVAFSPRKESTTVYVDRTDAHAADLAQLGPHTTGVSCIYIKDLDAVDHDVLRRIVAESEAFARGGGDDYAEITVTD